MIPPLSSRNLSLAPYLPYSHNSSSALHQGVNYLWLEDIITRRVNKGIKNKMKWTTPDQPKLELPPLFGPTFLLVSQQVRNFKNQEIDTGPRISFCLYPLQNGGRGARNTLIPPLFLLSAWSLQWAEKSRAPDLLGEGNTIYRQDAANMTKKTFQVRCSGSLYCFSLG